MQTYKNIENLPAIFLFHKELLEYVLQQNEGLNQERKQGIQETEDTTQDSTKGKSRITAMLWA